MTYEYKTKETCATKITFELDGQTVRNVEFTRGCDGNLKAIPRLVEGLSIDQVEEKLKGITCGRKQTSCADQLARAVREASDRRNESK